MHKSFLQLCLRIARRRIAYYPTATLAPPDIPFYFARRLLNVNRLKVYYSLSWVNVFHFENIEETVGFGIALLSGKMSEETEKIPKNETLRLREKFIA